MAKPDDPVQRFMEVFGVTEAEARAQMAHAYQKGHERHLDRCARAEAAARKRKDPGGRPRDEWRCIDISPAQHWERGEYPGRREAVFGRPKGAYWKFVVDEAGKRLAEGKAASMAAAMEQAEITGTLASMEPIGHA